LKTGSEERPPALFLDAVENPRPHEPAFTRRASLHHDVVSLKFVRSDMAVVDV
jgi:hypothetical protein